MSRRNKRKAYNGARAAVEAAGLGIRPVKTVLGTEETHPIQLRLPLAILRRVETIRGAIAASPGVTGGILVTRTRILLMALQRGGLDALEKAYRIGKYA